MCVEPLRPRAYCLPYIDQFFHDKTVQANYTVYVYQSLLQ